MTLASMSLFFLTYLFFCSNKLAQALHNENIIGARHGQINDFPYMVSIFQNNKFAGGGGIISDQFVITAAHCIADAKNKLVPGVKIVGGITEWEKDKNSKSKIEYRVIKAYFPKKHEMASKTSGHDIAVLKVSDKFDFKNNVNIRPLNLPKGNENYVGLRSILASFGYDCLEKCPRYDKKGELQYEGTTSGKLQFATVEIQDPKFCALKGYPEIEKDQFYAKITKTARVSENTLYGTCYGDSGSPLVYDNKVIGILTNGPFHCDERITPSTYTNVIYHKTLINNALKDVCDESFMRCETN